MNAEQRRAAIAGLLDTADRCRDAAKSLRDQEITERKATPGKATLLRAWVLDNGAAQHLYRLNPPLANSTSWTDDAEYTDYNHVVVSANTFPGSGPETYIFGADPTGEITNWSEQYPGSDRGHLNHAKALREAGYEVTS